MTSTQCSKCGSDKSTSLLATVVLCDQCIRELKPYSTFDNGYCRNTFSCDKKSDAIYRFKFDSNLYIRVCSDQCLISFINKMGKRSFEEFNSDEEDDIDEWDLESISWSSLII